MIQSPWVLRISNAERYYKDWESKYKCELLYRYYEGFQWSALSYRPYTMNVIYASIKSKIANFLYQSPEFQITPRASKMDWNQDFAVRSAQIKQGVLNALIQNPSIDITEDIKLAALDSFFRFGVIEVGYSATWDNPNKKVPYTTSHDGPLVDPDKNKVLEDQEVPVLEQVYFKHIFAKRFRVSTSDSPKLKNCNWCGYYEFIPKVILEKTKGIKLPNNFKDRYYSLDYADVMSYFATDKQLSPETFHAVQKGEVCKVWRIWDNVSQEKLLLLDGNMDELWSDKFERLPFSTHRVDLTLTGGWYPIPPVWQWISSQDEINESREQMRRYRRRFTRKFQVRKNSVSPDELDKLKNEIDGEIIETKTDDAIKVIPNPEIGISIQQGLITAKDDFDIIAGNPVSRGRASDRQTATAVNKISQLEQIRESIEQLDFDKFMCDIGREALLLAGERFSGGIWIKLTKDPGNFFEELQANQDVYQFITVADIEDGYDFNVAVNIINATPAQMEAEEAKYVKFLTLITQFPQISMSPTLVRETAFRVGYKNEKVIREMQKMALLIQMEKAAQAQQSLMGTMIPGQSGSSNGQANQTSQGIFMRNQANSPDQIQAQLQSQLGAGNA